MSSWSDTSPLDLAHISLISPLGASVELEVAAWFVGEGQLQDAAGHVYQGALLGGVPHGRLGARVRVRVRVRANRNRDRNPNPTPTPTPAPTRNPNPNHGSGVYVRDGGVTLEATFGGGLAHGPGELRP